MQKLTKTKLQDVLRSMLGLHDPLFQLEYAGGRIIGSVVSDTFRGKRDSQRQKMIWDVLDERLGPDAVKLVGMLLAYTPEEWQEPVAKPTRSPKAQTA
jgi:acid stress-induced BolA-like protein IbaG/YrbA